MTVARVTEVTATSRKSFDDAIKQGIKRANDTIDGITSAWVADQQVSVKNGSVGEYSVRMKVTFVLKASRTKTRKR